LVAIAEHPAIRPDGSLYAGPGYDRQTGVYVARGLDIPTRTPTRDDARAGLAKLCEAVTDFPFLAGCDRAAWVALVLTLLCRELAENVPAFVIGAPTPGTGKSLLADAAAVVATGRPAPRLPEPRDPEEERKRLIALALEGDRLALIDNLERGFGSGVLALALTSGAIRDRLLGESRTVTAPWRCVLVATANNPTIWGDVQRRVIPIDLDAGVERPEERDGFRHRDLLGWVRSNRPELVGAALDIVRGYLAAGSPEVETGPTFGSFESWERVVRHSIVWAGGADPCEGRARIQAAGDPIQDARRDLLRAWWRVAELRSAHVRELIACPEIAAAFEPLCRRGVTTTTAGQTLGRLKGRPMGGLVARSENDRDGVAVWTVSPAGVAGVAGVIPGPTRDETRNTQERETTPATPATPAPGAGKVVPL
jgi:putative DNA primase/helicase